MSTYGNALTYSQWQNAWNDSSISDVDCLARVIYAEDTTHTDGEYAVAKEILNRRKSGNPKRFARDGINLTWKNILFKSSAYNVATGSEAHCKNAMNPTKNSFWNNCVARAQELVNGGIPSSSLGNQKYHRASGSFNASKITGIDTSTIKAIGGNTFFDYLPGY